MRMPSLRVETRAQQRPVVHARRADDLARVEAIVRIKALFDVLEGRHESRTEHRLEKLGPNPAVAVLSRMRATQLARQVEGLLGDRTQTRQVVANPEVECGADVETADGGVRIPDGMRRVAFDDFGQPSMPLR